MRIKNIIILALVLALSMFVTGCTTKVVDKAPEGPAVTEGDKVEDEVKDEVKDEEKVNNDNLEEEIKKKMGR